MADATHLVLSRIRNLAHPATPWYRALWSVASHTAIDESIEYAEVAIDTSGNTEGLRYAASQAAIQVRQDLGVGTNDEREHLGELLERLSKCDRNKIAETDLDHLRHWSTRTRFGYFDRWSDAISSGAIHVERSARSIASALMDFGFSERWLSDAALARSGETDADVLARILSAATGQTKTPAPSFEVAIPLSALPVPLARWPEFRKLNELTTWLQAWDGELPDSFDVGAQQGGLVLPVNALDPYKAAAQASRVLRAASARHALSQTNRFAPKDLGYAFVRGHGSPIPLHDGRRRIGAPSLSRLTSDHDWSQPFNNAVEMVSRMEDANPAVVVSAGWAAIEGLLARGGEPGAIAADRMAAIVTCSWPKAELASLAWTHFEDDGAKGTSEKVQRFADLVASGDEVEMTKGRDHAALLRMRELFDAPDQVLPRVEGYLRCAFRRLYNQRNLAMHRGGRPSPAIDPAVRTMPALVGAGLDRIAAAQNNQMSPIFLAERCRIELDFVGKPGGRRADQLI